MIWNITILLKLLFTMWRKEIVESTQWEKFLTKQQNMVEKMVFGHIDQGIDKAKAQSCSKWKMKKKLLGFSFYKNVANFEAFL